MAHSGFVKALAVRRRIKGFQIHFIVARGCGIGVNFVVNVLVYSIIIYRIIFIRFCKLIKSEFGFKALRGGIYKRLLPCIALRNGYTEKARGACVRLSVFPAVGLGVNTEIRKIC